MLLEPSNEKELNEPEASSPSKPHPNETVVLDVLKTNEKIENCDELVIPDEMVMYLNQVVDDTTSTHPETSKIKQPIEKIKEEDLFTLLADVDVKPDDSEIDSVRQVLCKP